MTDFREKNYMTKKNRYVTCTRLACLVQSFHLLVTSNNNSKLYSHQATATNLIITGAITSIYLSHSHIACLCQGFIVGYYYRQLKLALEKDMGGEEKM